MRFRIAAKIIGLAAGGMWMMAAAGIWLPLSVAGLEALALDRALAVTLSLAALGSWAMGGIRDRVVERLADAVIASRRASLKTTRPLKAVP